MISFTERNNGTGGDIVSLILSMLSLRCHWDIQLEMSQRLLDVKFKEDAKLEITISSHYYTGRTWSYQQDWDDIGTVHRVRREKGLRMKLEKLQHIMPEYKRITLQRKLWRNRQRRKRKTKEVWCHEKREFQEGWHADSVIYCWKASEMRTEKWPLELVHGGPW